MSCGTFRRLCPWATGHTRSWAAHGSPSKTPALGSRTQETWKDILQHIRSLCICVYFNLYILFRVHIFFCFSVWGTFPGYLLPFGAKTCTLLNLGAKICHLHCSWIFPWFYSIFPWCSLIYPKYSAIFPWFSMSFPWLQLIFPCFQSMFPCITCTPWTCRK